MPGNNKKSVRRNNMQSINRVDERLLTFEKI
jgi:hypothetical protein